MRLPAQRIPHTLQSPWRANRTRAAIRAYRLDHHCHSCGGYGRITGGGGVMQHTVDTLMALAYKIRDARTYEWDASEAVEVGNTLRAALTEALAQPHIDCGWVTAADQEMIGAHLGVANLSDSHKSATAKLRQLIDWHIAVATDPAVNGGLSLQPVREREELLLREMRYIASISNGQVHRIAMMTLEKLKAATFAQPVREHLTAQVLHDFSPIFGGDK
jgi:hypothetical protein